MVRVKDASNTKNDALFKKIISAFSKDAHIYVIKKDSRNYLWIGSRGDGLLRVNMTDGTVKKYSGKNSYPNQIMSIEEDSKNRIWVGTRDNGLMLYLPEQDDFKIFDERDGLPSNTICAIEESAKGELWVSTFNGIAQVRDGRFISFDVFGKESGVNNAEFLFNVSTFDKNGEVYFAAENGIYRFERIQHSYPAKAPFAWTNFDLINGDEGGIIAKVSEDGFSQNALKSIRDGGSITLKHNQNNFQVGFATLDYTLPELNTYAYRLLGFDSVWRMSKSTGNGIRYLNLPSGEYVFQVVTVDPNGSWDNVPQSFSLKVMPVFWSTRGAFFLYALLLFAIGLLIRYLLVRWKRVNKKLSEKIKVSEIQDQQMVYYADLSHEIKNRLTLILGPLEDALANKKVNYQILNAIYDQSQRLKRLSDQIMNIRKSEMGDFLLSVGKENINEIAHKILEDAKPLAVVKGVKISCAPLKQNIEGWCDAEIIEIILMNLLNNAIKHCRLNDEVSISLDVQYMEYPDSDTVKEANFLVCTVRDSGMGIAEEDIPKITRPFFTKSGVAGKNDIKGTGIGLDLVARLVRKHHGNIEVFSEAGQFTAFVVYIPVDKTAFNFNELRPDVNNHPIVISGKSFVEDGLILPEAEIGNTGTDDTTKKGANLLIVDDDKDLLEYIKTIFESSFNVFVADSGEAALKLLRQERVDGVICDLDMPSMNGLTLCRLVKTDPQLQRIPFILLTGRNTEQQKLIAFKNGVDDFVEKPFSNELLSWRVKSLLRNSKSAVKTKSILVESPGDIITETEQDKFIDEMVELIEKNIDKDYLNVDFLAENMYMSRATFYRKMEEMLGESPSVFIKKYRLKKSAMYLKSGNYSLQEISRKMGFSNPKYFSKSFKSEFGVLPSDYVSENLQ